MSPKYIKNSIVLETDSWEIGTIQSTFWFTQIQSYPFINYILNLWSNLLWINVIKSFPNI